MIEEGKVYKARDFLAYTVEQMDTWPNVNFTLEFDDGEHLKSNTRDLTYSRFMWEIHRQPQFSRTPLLAKHHLKGVVGDNYITKDTHIQIFTNIVKEIYKTYSILSAEDSAFLNSLIYEQTNNLLDFIESKSARFYTTITALDFIEIVEHPQVKKIVESTEKTPVAVHEADKKIIQIIKKDPTLSHNNLAHAARTGMVKDNQAAQCVGIRGYLTEIDESIYREPVMSCFTKGLRRLYDIAVESRSCAKSLFYNKEVIQDTEYLARRIRLCMMYLEDIDLEPCKNPRYHPWHISKETYNADGRLVTVSGLPTIKGIRYIDPDTGEEKVSQGNEKHLEGKTLMVRTALSCSHPNPHKVCIHCFGELGNNYIPGNGLGHLCGTYMSAIVSQLVLSNKHYQESGVGGSISLNSIAKAFFAVSKRGNALKLRPELKKSKVKIAIDLNEVKGFTALKPDTDLHEVQLREVSRITSIKFYIAEKGKPLLVKAVKLTDGKKKDGFPYLSIKMLEYMFSERDEEVWHYSNEGLVIDMSHWDFNQEVLEYPEKATSIVAIAGTIDNLLFPQIKDVRVSRRSKRPAITIWDQLRMIHDVSNQKFYLNLSIAAAIIYALASHKNPKVRGMIRNSPFEEVKPTAKTEAHKDRSLSSLFSHEGGTIAFIDPEFYDPTGRPDFVLDALFMPMEVLKSRQKRGLSRIPVFKNLD